MSKSKKYPDVYVLMRHYRPTDADKAFDNRLNTALASVADNKVDYASSCGGEVRLIINDDTPGKETLKHLKRSLEKNGFIQEGSDYHIVSTNGQGSSYATFHIRQTFLELTSACPDAIAVMLDQDDRLKKNALRHIAKKMCKSKAGIIISPFEVYDPENLDIMDDAGLRHNLLARKLSKSGCLRLQKEQTFYLSSIGWTKSYTRSILSQYHCALQVFLKKERHCDESAISFFSNHRAYEDFIDYFPLLLKGCKVAGVSHPTHVYVKHKDSITSTPEVEDFLIHRNAMLLALIDLCYFKKRELQADFEYKLLRFLSVKVCQIEGILSKYRDNYYIKGDDRYAEFAAQTHDGYFSNKICRLALGEKRECSQDRELFQFDTARGASTPKNIRSLFSVEHLNSIPEYHLSLDAALEYNQSIDILRLKLRKAVECEKNLSKRKDTDPTNDNETLNNLLKDAPTLRKVLEYEKNLSKRKDTDPTNDDEALNNLLKDAPTPQNQRLKSLNYWVNFFSIITVIVVIVVIVIVAYLFTDSCTIIDVIKSSSTIIAAIISICVAVLTFLLNEKSKVIILSAEEDAQKKLYYSEFLDLIRHLEAGLKALIQIREKLESSESLRVGDIHFENLRWPDSSCLFSDDMAKIISKDRVDEFSRLRLNIRNINNSAQWLRAVANSSPNDLLRNLEWEMTRYFGYLINLDYLKTHGFSFPSQIELEMFVDENAEKNKLTKLFVNYPAKERTLQVDYFLRKYFGNVCPGGVLIYEYPTAEKR